MNSKDNVSSRLSSLAERRTPLERQKADPADPSAMRKSYRLNTNMRLDLQRKLDQRRVDGHGTKTDQLEEAVEIYLALYEGQGKLTSGHLELMERALQKAGRR